MQLTKTLIAAAMMMTASLTVSAADLAATIPFDFKVSGHKLPAGQYRVTSDMRTHTIRFDHRATGLGAIKLARVPAMPQYPYALQFDCAGTTCSFMDVVPANKKSTKMASNIVLIPTIAD